jgi:hypothetical protein
VEALELDGIASHVGTIAKPSSQSPQAPVLRAELIGDTCTTTGLTARGSAPVLALCRQLIAAGFDSAISLEAWRGEILCLRVRSIGEGATLTVAEGERGIPRFRLWKAMQLREGSPPARQIQNSDHWAGQGAEGLL